MSYNINSIEEYYNLTKQPWGKMFYELVWEQMNISNDEVYNILDFGSGFGITSNHFSENHKVTAIEPNPLMLEKRIAGDYEQFIGGIERVQAFPDNHFDFVVCHNVLEYCAEQEQIFKELARVLKNNGQLSLVKHNKEGKVLHTAVFNEAPRKALALYNDIKTDYSKSFGGRFIYSEEILKGWMDDSGLYIYKRYGVRIFFSLTQNNNVKYDPDWYSSMLELERALSEVEPYRSIAFFHHYLFVKNA